MEKIEVTQEIKALALAIRAYKHPLRQQILTLIKEREKIAVTDIWEALKCEQAVASQHLTILRRADLVSTERVGKYIFYRLHEAAINQLNYLAEYWANQGTGMEKPNAAKTITADKLLKGFFQNADLMSV